MMAIDTFTKEDKESNSEISKTTNQKDSVAYNKKHDNDNLQQGSASKNYSYANKISKPISGMRELPKDPNPAQQIMKCKTCKQCIKNSFCVACGDVFATCDCTTNVCLNCREEIYSDPARHRFGIAWFSLLNCFEHMTDENLARNEKKAKDRLLRLIQEVK